MMNEKLEIFALDYIVARLRVYQIMLITLLFHRLEALQVGVVFTVSCLHPCGICWQTWPGATSIVWWCSGASMDHARLPCPTLTPVVELPTRSFRPYHTQFSSSESCVTERTLSKSRGIFIKIESWNPFCSVVSETKPTNTDFSSSSFSTHWVISNYLQGWYNSFTKLILLHFNLTRFTSGKRMRNLLVEVKVKNSWIH